MARILRFDPNLYAGDLFTEADGNPRRGWWCEMRYWEDHRFAAWLERLVEDSAFDNLYWTTRALLHWRRYALVLSTIEQRVLDLELRCLKDKPHYTQPARIEWIADMMSTREDRWTTRQVLATLANVNALLADIERVRVESIMDWQVLRKTRTEWKLVQQLQRMEKTEYRSLVAETLHDAA